MVGSPERDADFGDIEVSYSGQNETTREWAETSIMIKTTHFTHLLRPRAAPLGLEGT